RSKFPNSRTPAGIVRLHRPDFIERRQQPPAVGAESHRPRNWTARPLRQREARQEEAVRGRIGGFEIPNAHSFIEAAGCQPPAVWADGQSRDRFGMAFEDEATTD